MTTGTLFTISLGANGNGWNGFTGVERIPVSVMTPPASGIVKVRLRLQASTSESFTITNAYIGHRAASGDAYDFATTPVQLLFGGSGSKVIAANTEEWSDWANFAYNKTSDFLFSFYCAGGASSDALRRSTSATSMSDYEKIANDAATVNKSGYSTNDNIIHLVNTIEYDTADAGVNFFPFF